MSRQRQSRIEKAELRLAPENLGRRNAFAYLEALQDPDPKAERKERAAEVTDEQTPGMEEEREREVNTMKNRREREI